MVKYTGIALQGPQQGGGLLAAVLDWVWNRTVAIVLLITLSPVLVGTAIAIKLDSRGPVLFRQPRVGSRRRRDHGEVVWEARVFDVFKFRSMFHGVDERAHEEHVQKYISGDLPGGEIGYKMTRDERVTRVGAVIRRLSIDELPQLINVALGDMNLVGPRPVPIYEVEGYAPAHLERLHALPGITGVWQVRGRGRVSFEEMIDMDIWYTRHRGFLVDLRLLFATIPAVLRMEGAK